MTFLSKQLTNKQTHAGSSSNSAAPSPTLLYVFHLQVEAGNEDAHSLGALPVQQLNDLKRTVTMTTRPITFTTSDSAAGTTEGDEQAVTFDGR